MGGDSEMMEEEYEEGFYRHEELRPETGGMRFEPRVSGGGTCVGVGCPSDEVECLERGT